MKPYDLENAEAELIAAWRSGDEIRIAAAEADVERLTPRPTPVSLHSAALWYAEQGLRIFPLSPGTKIPFKGSNGCLDATGNPDVIDGWWDRSPEANVGIATGYLVDVVDIDGHPGQVSRVKHWCSVGPDCDARQARPGEHPGEPADRGQRTDCGHDPGVFSTVDADAIAKVLTPRPGGMHIYVPATGDGNSAGLVPGVDYRGKGGYVVAPPSVITSGEHPGTYSFIGTPDFPALTQAGAA